MRMTSWMIVKMKKMLKGVNNCKNKKLSSEY
jgi:hypothetical protein